MSNHLALNTLVGGDFDPILVSPDQSNRITSCLRGMAADTRFTELMAAAQSMAHDDYWPAADSWQAAYKPYVVKGGILHVPVKGALMHNFPYAFGTYATGYYYIQKCIERGLADAEVKGIALVCDTPGGHVAGCFELCDRIYEARKVKPIRAFSHEHAYSAGYAVACSAEHITVSRTGGVGSIGVVTMHVNFQKALEMEGVEITFIFAGEHKVDGNPYQALSAGTKKRIQSRIDETYGVFCAQVARNRGLSDKAVRSTEALTFTASEAVTEGLADKIGAFDESMAEFSAYIMGDTGDTRMTTPANTVAQADHEAAVAQAAATARTEAKARIVAIKGLDEAKARPAAAEACAMDSDMTVDQAKAFLAKLPEEAKAAAPAPAAAAATNTGNPAFDKLMADADKGPGAAASDTQVQLTQEQKDQAAAARVLIARFGESKSAAKH